MTEAQFTPRELRIALAVLKGERELSDLLPRQREIVARALKNPEE